MRHQNFLINIQNLEKMSPLIAALDIRQFNHKTKKDKHINELLKNNLTSEEKIYNTYESPAIKSN